MDLRLAALGAIAGAAAAVIGACGGDGGAAVPRGAAPTITVHGPAAAPAGLDSPRVVAGTGPAAGWVEVRGIDRRMLRGLAGRAASDSRWRAAFRVTVDPGTMARDSGRPPVLGSYDVSVDGVRFMPRFPFEPGVRYRVELDPRSLAALAGLSPGAATAVIVHEFALAAPSRPRTTRVVGVYPSSARVPSNLLRLYVEFSAPMEPGEAYDHIRLLDSANREVQGAFLRLDQELWDPARRRLTVLLDPGRVKRGIRSNLEAGAPLVSGRRYSLAIDAAWRDATGAQLAEPFEHRFAVTPAERAPIDVAAWRLAVPRAGTLDSVHVDFGKPLDHALAGRTIAVYDERGGEVGGAGRTVADDRGWIFVPAEAWRAEMYTLRVWPELEDVAGNRIARPFDSDRAAGDPDVEQRSSGAVVRLLRFRPSHAAVVGVTVR